MTAVSTEVAPRRAIGVLPPEIQQAIELRRARNLAAAQIAGMSWGEKIDGDTRRAVAEWGQQFRVDVTTEIHVLGNRVYLNAAFSLRKLSEMVDAGLVEYAIADHVEDDPRLKLLGAEGEGEYTRRLRERIMHAVPEEAKSATVFRVKLRSMDREVTGCKWCGTGKKNQYGKLADPVGEEFPVETSESRAARRAMRQISSHLPPETRQDLDAIEKSAEILSARIAEGKQRVKARELETNTPAQMLAAPANPADPYSLDTREPVTVVPRPDPAPAAASHSSTSPDVGKQETAPASDRPRSAAAMTKMPFGMGAAKVGQLLHEVSKDDLADACKWAMQNSKYPEFIEAASIELDDRTNGQAQD